MGIERAEAKPVDASESRGVTSAADADELTSSNGAPLPTSTSCDPFERLR
jgi:hypothetical protein